MSNLNHKVDHHFLGKSKSVIIKHLGDYVEFLHWLYVPKLGVVLSFDKQVCCQIGKL